MKQNSVQDTTNTDLSMLAIKAADELERVRLGMQTEFNSVGRLAEILKNSLSQNPIGSDHPLRLDYVSVFSRAISNSISQDVSSKTILELVKEAEKVVSKLNPDEITTEEKELTKLISFCVALSDSAALYKEEIDELKKQVA